MARTMDTPYHYLRITPSSEDDLQMSRDDAHQWDEDGLQISGDDEDQRDDSPSEDDLQMRRDVAHKWDEDGLQMSSDDEDQSDDSPSEDDLQMSGDDSPSEDDLQISGDDSQSEDYLQMSGDDSQSEDDLQMSGDNAHQCDDSPNEDDLQMSGDAADQQLVVKKPLVHRSGFWDVSRMFLTEQLSVHTVTCQGRGTYIARSELLEKSGLSSQFSEYTLRRRCNQVIGGHQYATKELLRALKDQKLASSNSKKVAVVTVQQAKDILISFGHSVSIAHRRKTLSRIDVTTEMESLWRYLTDTIHPERKSMKGPIKYSMARNCLQTVRCKLID